MFGSGLLLVHLKVAVLLWIPLIIWFYLRRRYGYWRRHGVPSIAPTLFLGNMKPICLFRKSVADHFNDVYKDNSVGDSAAVGIHIFMRPALVVRDLDLVKAILVKDFASFSNR